MRQCIAVLARVHNRTQVHIGNVRRSFIARRTEMISKASARSANNSAMDATPESTNLLLKSRHLRIHKSTYLVNDKLRCCRSLINCCTVCKSPSRHASKMSLVSTIFARAHSAEFRRLGDESVCAHCLQPVLLRMSHPDKWRIENYSIYAHVRGILTKYRRMT